MKPPGTTRQTLHLTGLSVVHSLGVTDDESRRLASDNLVGIAEIGEMAGVSAAAVANWRTRARGFPEAVRELLIKLIVEAAEPQARKGDAFRAPSSGSEADARPDPKSDTSPS